ncbi:formyltetrahydrofolate deformylase [Govanella unica]|uniref:Formyltetrahydrofolate deformylase n=1 Tax=Govanella unica TaxID=2975056 RepID=A0A9X3TZP6_9PROT|nr:formyltetrahydrofolate deformylase [Govania unica]
MADFILSLTCTGAGSPSAARIGVESGVLDVLRSVRAVLKDCAHYRDPETGRLFMRLMFSAKEEEAVRSPLAARASTLGLEWQLTAVDHRPSVVVFVSKFAHCAQDLLAQAKELGMRVAAVLSNHGDFAPFAAAAGVPFYHLPIVEGRRQRQEAVALDLVRAAGAELVILARYMQVLSPDLVTALPCPVINIHHSLLPAFKGAEPYGQAYAAGVRVIGATAHYVTAGLDDGPIIEQEVARVSPRHSREDFRKIGGELERRTLARAVRLHLDGRVFRIGDRTFVLE